MRSIAVVPLLLLMPVCAAAQRTQAPADRPVRVATDSAEARLDAYIQPYVEQARASWPQARRRFEQGLPAGQHFFVTTRLHDADGRTEQVFVVVDRIDGDRISGRIWNDIAVVHGFRDGQPYAFAESELLDWLITHPDGSEEGNFVGKALGAWQAQRH